MSTPKLMAGFTCPSEMLTDGEAHVRTEREDGTLGGEVEDGGGEEIGDGCSDGVRVHGALAPSHRKLPPQLHARAHVVASSHAEAQAEPCLLLLASRIT